MATLKEEHPDVHLSIDDGLHMFRRSDRLCAGLSCDRTIERVMMRSTNTSDWLTRGRGVAGEITPVVTAVNASMCSSKPGNAGTHRG